MLKFTQAAPDFILKDQDGQNVNLRQFRNQWVVLYFYPRDDTPGCTQEAKDFTELAAELRKAKAVVLGVSKDDLKSHCSFIKKHSLGITLLSDPDHSIQEAYGVWQKKKFMGREFMGTVRTTILIDPQGRIAHIWENVKVNGHAQDVLQKLGEQHAR